MHTITACWLARLSLAAGLALASSQAAAIGFFLDQSNDLPDGTNYATVQIEALVDGRIQFTVDALDPPFSAGSNFGIQAFGFNVDDAFGVSHADIANSIVVQGDSGGKWKVRTDRNHSEFGVFDESAAGTGSTRKDPLIFTIEVAGDDVNTYAQSNGTAWFVAHIAGFEAMACTSGSCTSAWIAGGGDALSPPQAIPIPAAAWLFGSGLLGLAGIARRRRA